MSSLVAMWAYSDDGPVPSTAATRRMVSASYPSVATTSRAASVIRSTVIGFLRGAFAVGWALRGQGSAGMSVTIT